jgi:hypothetical protein
LIKKSSKALLIFCLILGVSSGALAQMPQTGSIKGTITDPEGNALPGVTVTVSSEALMGINTYVTTENGAYRFPALPPGTYIIATSMSGFKTIERGNIVVRTGMTVTINLTLELTTIEEEITVTAPAPTVDVESSKIAVVMDKELLKNIPMARDLYDIVNTAPGAVSEGVASRRTSAIHGATVRGTTYALEGVNMDDPMVRYPITNINFDVMEEVEMITGGHPASVGYTDGGYINVVTKSGGDKFSGGAILYFTNENMAQNLWPDEDAMALGVTQPSVDKIWIDGSLTFGGPIIKERIWFFSNARYIRQELTTNFIGPWTDILGRTHNPYEWSHEEKMGFFKLSSQITSNIKFVGMFNIVDQYRPIAQSPGPYRTYISTTKWDGDRAYTGSGVLSYVLNQNTFAELRVGYVHHWMPQYMQDEAQDLPYIRDYGSLYGALTSATYNTTYLRKKFQAGVYFTRFQDNFLGGNHEFKGGVDYEDAYGDLQRWRKDNMAWYLDSRNPNNYYYSDHGRVRFYIFAPEEGFKMIDRGRRIGAYIQDSVTFAERLTLNIGIRYDRSMGFKPAMDKAATGNPLSRYVGENVIRPYVAAAFPDQFPEGIDPLGALSCPEWSDLITWNSFSPRLGITYDLFGNGKTALKLSLSRYTEYFMLVYMAPIRPFHPEYTDFHWYDDNNNAIPDTADTFVPFPADFRGYDNEFAKERLDPSLKSPTNDELTLGILHELFRNFSLGVNFIYKNKKNIVFDALYGIDTNEYWYHPDQPAAQKYLIPFTTTVPGTDEYPDRTVTLYVQSNDAPGSFTRLTNIPELERKYWALEFVFNKRMSDGWQFNGSVVYSKAYGNIGGWYGPSQGWTGLVDNANDFVNSYGRIDIDRPLQIKLMGTAQLPYRIILSAYYVFMSGAPWNRTASIRPPTSWCTANNAYRTYYSVNIEIPGTRRYRTENWLDLRLEKEFGLGNYGRLGFYIDLLNVLGSSGVNIGQNDVYRWDPVAEGANQPGSVRLATNYKVISSVSGLRTIKVSVRFSF